LNTYKTESCELSGVTGIKDIYLVFKTDMTNSCRLNFFSFQKTIGDEVKSINNDDDYKLNIYPNPASSVLTINYYLPVSMDVKIEIYNIQGKIIKSSIGKMVQPGYHELEINTEADQMTAGIYILKFNSGTFTKSINFSVVTSIKD
jgi:hypothetical protein